MEYGSECTSGTLLNGRGTMKNGGAEPKTPNTLDGCPDGNSGSYHSDESLDKIVVRSGEVNDPGPYDDMVEGARATVIATVFPYGTGANDYADFYYAGDALNPTWKFIGTVKPSQIGSQDLKMSYTLPPGHNQAVRVNFRYKDSASPCATLQFAHWIDRDDLGNLLHCLLCCEISFCHA